MKRGANNPRRHHYVPRSYLERFTDSSGFLHVYDRTSKQWRRQKPNNIMHIRDYNRQEWAQEGVDQIILEKGLGSWLEVTGKNVIDSLILSPPELCAEDIATFLVYLEFQRIRVPRQEKMAKALMRDTILRLAPVDIVADIQAGKFQLSMKKSARFDYMRLMSGKLHPWFARMEWEVIEAESGSAFVTTDSPVSLYNADCPPPAEAGIAFAGTVVFFPLGSRYLLLIRHPEYRMNNSISRLDVLPDPILGDSLLPITHGVVWSREVVTRHNWRLVQLSDRLVVGENKEVLEQCISLHKRSSSN
jgi:hypothetical protein